MKWQRGLHATLLGSQSLHHPEMAETEPPTQGSPPGPSSQVWAAVNPSGLPRGTLMSLIYVQRMTTQLASRIKQNCLFYFYVVNARLIKIFSKFISRSQFLMRDAETF